ncbi:hypothetical protein BX616_010660, partial [Lobosporangium transversale]
MASWVNHTSATMQNQSGVRRNVQSNVNGSIAPFNHQQQSIQPQSTTTYPSYSPQQQQQQQQQFQFKQYQPLQQQHLHHQHYLQQQQTPSHLRHSQVSPQQHYPAQQHTPLAPIHMQPRPPAPAQHARTSTPLLAFNAQPNSISKMVNAQGTFSTYASRIRDANSALILPPALGRRAKRAVMSMAESDEDDWDFEDSLRSTPTRHQYRQAAYMGKERSDKGKKGWAPRPRKTRHTF